MRISDIGLLKCIKCEGRLELSDINLNIRDGGSVESGILRCQNCKESFPIIDRVGIFFPKETLPLFINDYEKRVCANLGIALENNSLQLDKEMALTKRVSDNWSYQWNNLSPWTREDFEKDDFKGERCFKKFILINPEEYSGKRVVVWCGGSGREAYHISKYNPRMLIVNDIGDGIYRLDCLIDKNINLLLLRCDMLQNPLRNNVADISICDHALQHVIEKEKAFHIIADVLAPSGTAAICVYSYENNFLMTHIIEPLKGIIHKMSIKSQEAIAFIPATLIFLLIRLFYLPANYFFPKNVKSRIPLFEHMMFWSKGSFRMLVISCFDLIHAPVSYHFKKNELEKMAERKALFIKELVNTYGTTWSMRAEKQ